MSEHPTGMPNGRERERKREIDRERKRGIEQTPLFSTTLK